MIIDLSGKRTTGPDLIYTWHLLNQRDSSESKGYGGSKGKQ
jgi:hypothetical protein